MKKLTLALAVVSASTVFAGIGTVPQVPDAGASVLLLTIGVAAVSLGRKFRR